MFLLGIRERDGHGFRVVGCSTVGRDERVFCRGRIFVGGGAAHTHRAVGRSGHFGQCRAAFGFEELTYSRFISCDLDHFRASLYIAITFLVSCLFYSDGIKREDGALTLLFLKRCLINPTLPPQRYISKVSSRCHCVYAWEGDDSG